MRPGAGSPVTPRTIRVTSSYCGASPTCSRRSRCRRSATSLGRDVPDDSDSSSRSKPNCSPSSSVASRTPSVHRTSVSPGSSCERGLLVHRLVEDADGRAAAAFDAHQLAARLAPDERRQVAGVGQRHLLGLHVERQIDPGDEDVVLLALEHRLVDARDGARRRRLGQRRHAQVARDARHQERRRHALARDVADEDADALVIEPEQIVEVAADRIGRPILGDELDPLHRRQLPRQERLLDLLGEQQILLQPLLLERLGVHARVLQRHRRLRRQPGQQIEVALVERDQRASSPPRTCNTPCTSLPKIIGACIDSPARALGAAATSGADKMARPFCTTSS